MGVPFDKACSVWRQKKRAPMVANNRMSLEVLGARMQTPSP